MIGEQITCRLYAGGKVVVDVDDRVLSDRTAGQYENGWWVSDEELFEYFLSESGILWGGDTTGNSWRRLFQHAIGYHVPTMRTSRNFDRMVEAMAEGFTCGTKVCTCQMVSHKWCPVHG